MPNAAPSPDDGPASVPPTLQDHSSAFPSTFPLPLLFLFQFVEGEAVEATGQAEMGAPPPQAAARDNHFN